MGRIRPPQASIGDYKTWIPPKKLKLLVIYKFIYKCIYKFLF